MTKDEAGELRRRAEARLHGRPGPLPTYDEALRALHELEVHQIELELQNEALVAARDEAHAALARAVDLFDNAPVAYFTLDAEGRVREANRAALRLVHLGPGEVNGRPLASFFAATNARDVGELVAAAHLGQPASTRELTLATRHASDAVVELGVVSAAGGDELRAVALDVTDRSRSARALREADKMSAVGRLASGIAHDVNNVLAIMVAHVELAAATAVPPDAAVLLRDTLDAAERAKALTRQLLAFGRGQPSRPVVVELNGFIGSLATMLRRLLGGVVELRCELSPEPLHVQIDPSHLDQVVVNLVLNGRDAMPEGGLLRITTAREREGASGHGRVLLAVHDHGLGIDPETASRIFEPFFTTKPGGHGAGMGLTTVWTVVNEAGGSIGVKSARFHGTTMEVRLPLVAPPHAEATEAPAKSPRADAEVLLLVDDEPQLLEVVRRALVALGYEVLCAANAEEALRIAERYERRIDLVLSDVHMPGMSGGKLVERLREARPEIRAVLMSGNLSEHAERRGGAGGTPLLAKPFRMDELASVLRRALEA